MKDTLLISGCDTAALYYWLKFWSVLRSRKMSL